MKLIWEEKDIKAGRKVAGHGQSEKFIIGYRPETETKTFCLISLSDGLVGTAKAACCLTEELTENNFIPDELLHLWED